MGSSDRGEERVAEIRGAALRPGQSLRKRRADTRATKLCALADPGNTYTVLGCSSALRPLLRKRVVVSVYVESRV